MKSQNLKDLSIEALKKRDQQLKFVAVVAFILSMANCQKLNFYFFLFFMVFTITSAFSGEVGKEIKSRQ